MGRIFLVAGLWFLFWMSVGLFIARSLIEAQGGRLWFDSGSGPGSTFAFALPAAR